MYIKMNHKTLNHSKIIKKINKNTKSLFFREISFVHFKYKNGEILNSYMK